MCEQPHMGLGGSDVPPIMGIMCEQPHMWLGVLMLPPPTVPNVFPVILMFPLSP